MLNLLYFYSEKRKVLRRRPKTEVLNEGLHNVRCIYPIDAGLVEPWLLIKGYK